jgi:hypothetical protein
MVTETKRADDTQKALWAIKEAAWELYGKAFWKDGVAKLVDRVCADVDETTRTLGYDPTYIIK